MQRIYATAALAAVVMIAAIAASPAQAPDKERIDNVVAAATALAKVETEKGIPGAYVYMSECYQRELPHSRLLTRPLEQCVAQDMIISRVYAEFSKAMAPDVRKQNQTPEAQELMEAMTERVIATFQRMRVTPEEGAALTEVVRTHGMQAYGKTRYPDRVR